jgi:hypothetical protein
MPDRAPDSPAVALHFQFYNFARPHKSPKNHPAFCL